MTRQQERAQLRQESKRRAPEKGVNPSGVFPTKYFGQTPDNPVGILQTRGNVRKHFYLLSAQMRRYRRLVEFKREKDGTFARDENGDRIPVRVLHETKGWQSARVAA